VASIRSWMRVRTSSQVGTASDGLAPTWDCPDAANPEASIMRTGRREASFAGSVRGIGVEPLGALVEVDPARGPVSRVAEPALDVHPPRLAGLRVGAHQQHRLLRPHPVGDVGRLADEVKRPVVLPGEPAIAGLALDEDEPVGDLAGTGLRSSISPSVPASVFRSCQTNPILLTCWWISVIPPSPVCALTSIFFSGHPRHRRAKEIVLGTSNGAVMIKGILAAWPHL